MKLVVVESPGKIKTIQRFLGNDYKIMASNGHIMNLPDNKLGVDIKNGFEPEYTIIPGRKGIIEELKRMKRESTEVYLAPDPDREGEAIANNLAQVLNIDPESKCRIVFQEITRDALKQAIKNPRGIDKNKVEAQKSRRVLDRLAGYLVSPLLWKKIGKGLSAGRVQSVALRLICDREINIEDFKPVKYYRIIANYRGKTYEFKAEVVRKGGKRFRIEDGNEAKRIVDILREDEQVVVKIVSRKKRENPPMPFITSSLQQEANQRLGFSAERTMRVAQRLYEGIDIGGEGPVGLITYMRTDSIRISDTAKAECREYIIKGFGEEYVGGGVKPKNKKAKFIQDAHEAIRPTYITNLPDNIKKYLSQDEFRLYKLIWERFVASQMAPRVFHETVLILGAGEYELEAKAVQEVFDGFRVILKRDSEGNKSILSNIKKGVKIRPVKVEMEEKETQPPVRYTEATLIKALEKEGVGRPSTYAVILKNIQQRRYVIKREKRFFPTDLGLIVNDMLKHFFKELVDIKFTAQMESHLDNIESGKESAKNMLEDFYKKLNKDIERAKKKLEKIRIILDDKCPECGKNLMIIYGKNGRFIACENYPNCKFTGNIPDDLRLLAAKDPINGKKSGVIEFIKRENQGPEIVGKCPECGGDLVVKHGRFGEFIACSSYPECKYTRKDRELIQCPKDGCDGYLVRRRGKRGRYFYGCSNYPECNFISPKKPDIPVCDKCDCKMKLDENNNWFCPECDGNK